MLRAAWVAAVGRVMLSLTFYMGTMLASSNMQCFQGVSANQVMYDPSEHSLSLLIALSPSIHLSRKLSAHCKILETYIADY